MVRAPTANPAQGTKLTEIGITPGVDPDHLKHFFEEIHRLTKKQ